MPELKYRLVVLTHGEDKTLSRTLESFQAYVSPLPTEWAVHADGSQGRKAAHAWANEQDDGQIWHHFSGSWTQEGFCTATQKAWHLARKPGVEFVFWLEHDFEFTKKLELGDLATVLDSDPLLLQMALYREPVNADEQRYGGYLQQHEGAYRAAEANGYRWFETQRNWTTNPSLIPRRVTNEFEWPLRDQCEGHFGFDVKGLEPNAIFGIWGDGEPWCRHIGERTGYGY